MEPLGTDSIRDETQSLFSAIVHEVTKPISSEAVRAIEEEPSHEIKILENQKDVIEKLGQQELEITEKIHNLWVNYTMLGQKLRGGYFKFTNAQSGIERTLKEIESLKQSLYELYEKPNEQIVKLHKGTHHGCMNFVKERQLLKQITQARGEAENMSANGPTKVYTWGSHIALDTKKAIKDHIKVRSFEIEELRMERKRYRACGRLDFEQATIEKEITIFKSKLKNIKQMKVEASMPQLNTQQMDMKV